VCKVGHSSVSRFKFKNAWSYAPYPPLHLNVVEGPLNRNMITVHELSCNAVILNIEFFIKVLKQMYKHPDVRK
jgi:hypothetical protein